jgi:hypothetical protein
MQSSLFRSFRKPLIGAIFFVFGCSDVCLAQNSVALQYSGSDGTLEYDWTAPSIGTTNSLGTFHVNANFLQASSCQFDLALTVNPTAGSLQLQSVTPVTNASGTHFLLVFAAVSGQATVTIHPSISGKALNTGIEADAPVIGAVNLSGWPASLNGQSVPVPYYSQQPEYFPSYGIFANSYFDWQHSNASQLNVNQAAYWPLTNGVWNRVKERLVLRVSEDFADVLPHISNAASPYMQQLAGRTVLDIWGMDTFPQIAQGLSTLQDYGLQNCVVLIHDWQRSGYDNALPAIFPANANLGGSSGMQQAVRAGQAAGCYVGLHENYLDYYPDYDYFTPNAIARNSDNSFILSWFNSVTGIQSYATKPTWILPNAETESPEIQTTYGTDASFIDVNSAVSPWSRPDMDATQSNAGSLVGFSTATTSLWSYERQIHNGPVLGEGADHWYWSGLLDGVEAQLGAGAVAANSSTQVPLLVDFDLLKIHPRQVNHGMGYYERWVAPGESMTNTISMDAYRMQEVAFGHAPFVGNMFWSSVARVLQEQNQVGIVAARYGVQKVHSIQYQLNGDWYDTNTAISSGDWSRVLIKYANGDQIVANSQPQSLTFDGVVIPQYGWLAHGTDLLAYTALINGQIADYAQTGSSYFANARNQKDLEISDTGALAEPFVSSFQQTAPGTGQMQIQWQVFAAMPSNPLKNFVHFVNPLQTTNAGIVFGADHFPTIPTNGWSIGQTVTDTFVVSVPPGTPDGTYSVRIGLYDTEANIRYPLLGNDDQSYDRYIVGNLTSTNGGQILSFQPVPFAPSDPRLNVNGTVVDFGAIQTDGMISMVQAGGNWVLSAYPRNRNVTIRLKAAILPAKTTVSCDSGTTISNQKPTAVGGGLYSINTQGQKTCTWPVPASK